MLTTQDQERLKKAMTDSREWQARHQPLDGIPVYGAEDIIKPSRFGWMIWPVMGVFLGFIVVIGIASI